MSPVVTLIELVAIALILGMLGTAIGALVGWAASWPLLLSAACGAGAALLLGAITFAVAIRISDARGSDGPSS